MTSISISLPYFDRTGSEAYRTSALDLLWTERLYCIPVTTYQVDHCSVGFAILDGLLNFAISKVHGFPPQGYRELNLKFSLCSQFLALLQSVASLTGWGGNPDILSYNVLFVPVHLTLVADPWTAVALTKAEPSGIVIGASLYIYLSLVIWGLVDCLCSSSQICGGGWDD